MLCVHRPSLYKNSLANDISLMSIQEDQYRPAKIRKIHPHTTDQNSYTHDVFMETKAGTPQNLYSKESVSHFVKR